jgi:hypothetical protein
MPLKQDIKSNVELKLRHCLINNSRWVAYLNGSIAYRPDTVEKRDGALKIP